MTEIPGLTEQEYDERHRLAIIRPHDEAPGSWVRKDYMKTAMLIDTLNVLCEVQDDRDRLVARLAFTASWLAKARKLLHESCDHCNKQPAAVPLCVHCEERWLLAESICKFQQEGGPNDG